MTDSYFFLAIATITVILSLIKIWEIWNFSILWVIKNGKSCSDEFHLIHKQKGPQKAIEAFSKHRYLPWPILGKLYKLKPRFIFKIIVDRVYRFPYLVLANVTLLLLTKNVWLYSTLSGITILIIYTRLLQQIISRMQLGVLDNLTQYWAPRFEDITDVDKIDWNVSRILRGTLSDFIAYTVLTIFSYSIIFCKLEIFDARYFFPTDQILTFHEALYFSVVTITTVGFGEIHPKETLSMYLVLSEIIAIWSTVILIFFHYQCSLAVNLIEENNNT